MPVVSCIAIAEIVLWHMQMPSDLCTIDRITIRLDADSNTILPGQGRKVKQDYQLHHAPNNDTTNS